MRIEQIFVDGYGKFARWSSPQLAEGLTIVCGPNESGKSTLQRFIVTVLFGFPARNGAGWIEALEGGRLGGRLAVRDDQGRPWIIERHHDGQRQQLRLTMPDGSEGGQAELDALVGGISRATFEQIFAVDLDDLQSIDQLPQAEVGSRIYGAGLGAERAPEMLNQLERDAGEIFKPNGRIQPAAKLFSRLHEIEEQIQEAGRRVDAYPALVAERAEIQSETEATDARLTALREQLRQIDELQRLRENVDLALTRLGADWNRERLRTQGVLDRDLATVREFSESLGRLNVRLDEAERRVSALPDPDQAIAAIRRVDDALIAWQEMQQTGAGSNASVVSGWMPFLIIGAGVLALVVGAITTPVWMVAGAVLIGAAVLLILMGRLSKPNAGGQPDDSPEAHFQQLCAEAGVDPRAGVNGLNQARGVWIHRREQAITAAKERNNLDQQLQTQRKAWRTWLAGHGLSSDLDPEAAGDLLRKISDAREALADEEGLRPEQPDALGEGREALVAQIRAVESEQRRRHQRLGELRHEIGQLETSLNIQQWRAERSASIAQLDEVGRAWSKLTVARALLSQAIQRFEEQYQPEVLRRATEMLGTVTDGAYTRAGITVGSERDVVLIASDGRRVTADQLSRGTREQLYLALRLGLASARAERSEALPLLFDDVLVNHDPARAEAFATIITEVAQTQQVLLFTCNPATVQAFERAGAPQIIELKTR